MAIKVLPPTHTLDPARKARFLAEARTASSLNHPNIVTIFDVGREGDTDYLVMEYIEGRTLRAVLRKGRLDWREALEIAAQLASGLAAAHGKGIVHRDLKPENVMICPNGTAKILDYGVAKLLDHSESVGPATETAPVTSPGAIVGTIAYMSPEQLQSQEIDHRSDVFSLGVVVSEMLSGRNPFAAPSVAGVIQRITSTPPPLDEIPAATPPRAREAILRALAPRPADRYQCARDLELDLRAIVALPASQEPVPSRASSSRWRAAFVAVACLAAAALGALAGRLSTPQARSETPRLAFAPLTRDPGYEGEPTFSADGQTIAYVSDRTGNFDIFLKQVSGGPDINLTNDPGEDVQPAFSPDGKQIAFVSTRSSRTPLVYRTPDSEAMGGDIWVMPALGGTPRRIVQDGNFPAWSPDSSSIIFVRGTWNEQKLYRAPSTGGSAAVIPMSLPGRPLFVTAPGFSPDGKWISFSTQSPNNICVMPAAGGAAAAIAEGQYASWQPDSRSIVYSDLAAGRNATLSLVRIDDKGRRMGEPEPITSGRGEDRTPATSPDGTTVIFASQTVSFNLERVAFDATAGKPAGPPEPITRGGDFCPFFTVAPDGSAVVFQSQRGVRQTLWRQEIASGVLTQLAGGDDTAYRQPEWSPDGKQIAFVRQAAGSRGETWIMSSDGANPRKVGSHSSFVSWTPDSRGLVFFDGTHRDLRLLDLVSGQVRVLANEGKVRTLQKISADGKWMVYQAGESGSTEVRAVEVGNTRSRVLVRSARENLHPFFSPDMRWVYFQPDHKNVYRIPGPAQGWKSAPPQQVTFFPESNLYLEQPQLSADGKYLYYSRRSASSDLWLGKRDGTRGQRESVASLRR